MLGQFAGSTVPPSLVVAVSLTACVAPTAGESPHCTVFDEEGLASLAEDYPDGCALQIQDTQLTSLDAMGAYDDVHGAVIFINNPLLADFDGLAPAIAAAPRGMSFIGPSLTSLSVPPGVIGLNARETDMESISASTPLQSVILNVVPVQTLAFPSSTSVEIVLRDLPDLETLVGTFPDVTEITRLEVCNCPQVTTAEIEALGALVLPGKTFEHCGNLDDGPCDGQTAGCSAPGTLFE